MPRTCPMVIIGFGNESFDARLRHDLSPQSCTYLERLMPYHGQVVHASWSGEACWSPMSGVWPSGTRVASENSTTYPGPGQVLLYTGVLSEPELLIPYGPTCFASRSGPLAGNPVLTIVGHLGRLARIGHRIHWHGAMDLRIERVVPTLCD